MHLANSSENCWPNQIHSWLYNTLKTKTGDLPAGVTLYPSTAVLIGTPKAGEQQRLSADHRRRKWFKRKMVQKLTGPNAISALALSKQVDVPQTTLSKWLRNAGIDTPFSFSGKPNDTVQMRSPVTKKRPNDWSPVLKVVFIEFKRTKNDQSPPTIKSGHPSSAKCACGNRSLPGLELGYNLPALAGTWNVFLPIHVR